MPSEIEKEASIYSKACKKVKKTPRKIVRPKLISEDGLSPKTMALWDQVQVAPESSNITVLSKGTSQGFKTSIPGGGHTPPISKAGDKLEAKKAQKKAKKNIASDKIKSSIAKRKPDWTALVWCP